MLEVEFSKGCQSHRCCYTAFSVYTSFSMCSICPREEDVARKLCDSVTFSPSSPRILIFIMFSLRSAREMLTFQDYPFIVIACGLSILRYGCIRPFTSCVLKVHRTDHKLAHSTGTHVL
ncbi:hypothetical protein M758_3G041100 [Ceratodon purpureus]|uniref:Uncharacterized protein n=1 Tax=Ceratodon purpureus TaxID=3225 RepID=A0A8T0IH26_CERPU|nr:hypothetical protein KC19_3G042900 [Ceratodon purpureus]KAG0621693.1 hypothetical protein M758_3G041100 [Ceratodon purpureus]